jgi:glycine/D-amino acid oxidase-like deaminating enzyme
VAVASGVDTCSYDLVADDDFILGPVPGADGVFTGVGWRGTGYKFAPWVGLVLARLALGQNSGYDIGRFTPARFARGASARSPEGGGVPA